MKISNVGNNAVNLYLLDSGTHRLLIDSGFPGQMQETGRQLRKTGFRICDIDFLIVTHFHVDHAGEIQALKNEGIQFLVVDVQLPFIEPMEKMIKGKWGNYTSLNEAGNTILSIAHSRDFFKTINIDGEVVHTPGHSEDSISIVLDSGEAFTGDLPAEHLYPDNTQIKTSWRKLKSLNVKIVYPSHVNNYELTIPSSE